MLLSELLAPDLSSLIREKAPLLQNTKTRGSQATAEGKLAHQAQRGHEVSDSPGGRPKVQLGSSFYMNF